MPKQNRIPPEKKSQIISRILAKEISIRGASHEYGLAESTLFRWLSAVRSKSEVSTASKSPLPRGMKLIDAVTAWGYCSTVGLHSAECGQHCRKLGITLDELKTFGQWLSQVQDLTPKELSQNREKELAHSLATANAEKQTMEKELNRKEKALAESAALLVLSKKARAIWGDEEN